MSYFAGNLANQIGISVSKTADACCRAEMMSGGKAGLRISNTELNPSSSASFLAILRRYCRAFFRGSMEMWTSTYTRNSTVSAVIIGVTAVLPKPREQMPHAQVSRQEPIAVEVREKIQGVLRNHFHVAAA